MAITLPDDFITKITATEPKAETATKLTFTVKANSLKQEDVITLTTSATGVTSTDKSLSSIKMT